MQPFISFSGVEEGAATGRPPAAAHWMRDHWAGRGLPAPRGRARRTTFPIDLPNGRQLMTLMDAGDYITELPKAEHDAPEWQAAMQALLLVLKRHRPTMFARIAVTRALHRNEERVFCRRPE